MTNDLIIVAEFRGHFYAVHFDTRQKREAIDQVVRWVRHTELQQLEGECIADHIEAACHCAEAEERERKKRGWLAKLAGAARAVCGIREDDA